ncbi:MAG: hypothetical protein LCH82_02395 [Actinobacteria bacterium]|nr:hypothetical protein [Actinomycetota bacterium]
MTAPVSNDPQESELVYRFGLLDTGFPAGGQALTVKEHRTLLEKLGSYETQTVKEIWGSADNGCKGYPVGDLPSASGKRLLEIDHDDEDTLHSLRAAGAFRIWGILRGNVFHLLWVDPKHEVWPSAKKHT